MQNVRTDSSAVCQILAVAVQQVEGDEARLVLSKQQFVELGLAVAVETHDLAVEDDRALELVGEGFRECAERFELVSIARDELAAPVLDVSQGTEAVVLDLEQPVLMGEWFRAPL